MEGGPGFLILVGPAASIRQLNAGAAGAPGYDGENLHVSSIGPANGSAGDEDWFMQNCVVFPPSHEKTRSKLGTVENAHSLDGSQHRGTCDFSVWELQLCHVATRPDVVRVPLRGLSQMTFRLQRISK